MKKVVFTGFRIFVKFEDFSYFENRAAEAGLEIVYVVLFFSRMSRPGGNKYPCVVDINA